MKNTKPNAASEPLQFALQALPFLDIPAKGRIAHHIRTGRLDRAISLCAAGQLFLWNLINANAHRLALLEQLSKLNQVESLLRRQAGSVA